MRARKAKTEIRREQIAHAALRLLAVQGWQGVSLLPAGLLQTWASVEHGM